MVQIRVTNAGAEIVFRLNSTVQYSFLKGAMRQNNVPESFVEMIKRRILLQASFTILGLGESQPFFSKRVVSMVKFDVETKNMSVKSTPPQKKNGHKNSVFSPIITPFIGTNHFYYVYIWVFRCQETQN